MPRWLVYAALGLFSLFFVTSTSDTFSPDTTTNLIQAHSLGADHSVGVTGSPDLGSEEVYGKLAWFVDSDQGLTSKYPPGVAAWGALFYQLDGSTQLTQVDWTDGETSGVSTVRIPSTLPARLAAVTAATLAVVFIGLAAMKLLDEQAAQMATLIAATGTGIWSVAADELWQHSPNIMWISLGVYLAACDRLKGSGLAFAAAVFTRPHTAVIAATMALIMAVRRRSIRPIMSVGATSILGIVALVLYNRYTYGTISITGGYESFSESASSTSILELIGKFGDALFDRKVGLLMTSPILAVALLGVPSVAKRAPDWASGAALGGLVYLVIQYKANRVSGGAGFFGYRYPLEALAASAPFLALAAATWMRRRRVQLLIGVVLATASVLFNAYGAITQ